MFICGTSAIYQISISLNVIVFLCGCVCVCVVIQNVIAGTICCGDRHYAIIRYKSLKKRSVLLFARILYISRAVEICMKPLFNLEFCTVGLHQQSFPE
jgi:hypothetical protein